MYSNKQSYKMGTLFWSTCYSTQTLTFFIQMEKRVLWYQIWERKTLPRFQQNASIFIKMKVKNSAFDEETEREEHLLPDLWPPMTPSDIFSVVYSYNVALFFTFALMKTETFSQTWARFSNLQVGIRERSFPFHAEANWEAVTSSFSVHYSGISVLVRNVPEVMNWILE